MSTYLSSLYSPNFWKFTPYELVWAWKSSKRHSLAHIKKQKQTKKHSSFKTDTIEGSHSTSFFCRIPTQVYYEEKYNKLNTEL